MRPASLEGSAKRVGLWLEARGWDLVVGSENRPSLFQATNRSNACIAKCEYGLDSAPLRVGCVTTTCVVHGQALCMTEVVGTPPPPHPHTHTTRARGAMSEQTRTRCR